MDDEAFTFFEKLDDSKQLALKANYLKQKREHLNEYRDKWTMVSETISSTIRALSNQSQSLLKT